MKREPQQSALARLLSETPYTSQHDANQFLQRHGLSIQMKADGTGDVFDEALDGKRVAVVNFTHADRSQPRLAGINY